MTENKLHQLTKNQRFYKCLICNHTNDRYGNKCSHVDIVDVQGYVRYRKIN